MCVCGGVTVINPGDDYRCWDGVVILNITVTNFTTLTRCHTTVHSTSIHYVLFLLEKWFMIKFCMLELCQIVQGAGKNLTDTFIPCHDFFLLLLLNKISTEASDRVKTLRTDTKQLQPRRSRLLSYNNRTSWNVLFLLSSFPIQFSLYLLFIHLLLLLMFKDRLVPVIVLHHKSP